MLFFFNNSLAALLIFSAFVKGAKEAPLPPPDSLMIKSAAQQHNMRQHELTIGTIMANN